MPNIYQIFHTYQIKNLCTSTLKMYKIFLICYIYIYTSWQHWFRRRCHATPCVTVYVRGFAQLWFHLEFTFLLGSFRKVRSPFFCICWGDREVHDHFFLYSLLVATDLAYIEKNWIQLRRTVNIAKMLARKVQNKTWLSFHFRHTLTIMPNAAIKSTEVPSNKPWEAKLFT